MKTDTEFYELARALPAAFPLLFMHRRPCGRYRVMSPTLKRSERRIDLVFQPSDPRDPWWVVECQAWPKERAERGLFRKALNYADDREIWGRVRAAMVYTTAAVARASLPAALGPPGAGGTLNPVRVILGDLGPEELLALGPELFPLIPLSKVAPEEISRHMPVWLKKVIKAGGAKSRTFATLKEQFLRICMARFQNDTMTSIQRRLGEKMIPIEKTRCGRDLIQIGEKKGRREGRREGREEGIQEGIEEGIIEAVLQTMEVRFGRTPPRIRRLLECRRDAKSLRSILRAAIKARDLESFVEHIGGSG